MRKVIEFYYVRFFYHLLVIFLIFFRLLIWEVITRLFMREDHIDHLGLIFHYTFGIDLPEFNLGFLICIHFWGLVLVSKGAPISDSVARLDHIDKFRDLGHSIFLRSPWKPLECVIIAAASGHVVGFYCLEPRSWIMLVILINEVAVKIMPLF